MKKLEIINRYLKLKQREKELAEEIADQKPWFFHAMDSMECDQLETSGALIYKSERRTFEYSKAIIDAEKKLRAMKKAFEEENTPASVSHSWNVKF